MASGELGACRFHNALTENPRSPLLNSFSNRDENPLIARERGSEQADDHPAPYPFTEAPPV